MADPDGESGCACKSQSRNRRRAQLERQVLSITQSRFGIQCRAQFCSQRRPDLPEMGIFSSSLAGCCCEGDEGCRIRIRAPDLPGRASSQVVLKWSEIVMELSPK